MEGQPPGSTQVRQRLPLIGGEPPSHPGSSRPNPGAGDQGAQLLECLQKSPKSMCPAGSYKRAAEAERGL